MTLPSHKLAHWTPRYAYNRIRLYFYELRYPDRPWLTKDSIELLDFLLDSNDVGLEFGSGRSSIWIGQRIKSLVSIEANEPWFDKVKGDINRKGITNIDLRFRSRANTDYLSVLEEFGDDSLDFALVDGALRDHCAYGLLNRIKKGGILVVDDVNQAIPNDSPSPDSLRDGYRSELWKNFDKQTKTWRRIWTTNGVTDTLILLKR